MMASNALQTFVLAIILCWVVQSEAKSTLLLHIFKDGQFYSLDDTSETGSSSQRIIGGTPATFGEFPYQAGLAFFRSCNSTGACIVAICGGFVLNSKTIGTAGHCVNHPDTLGTLLPYHFVFLNTTIFPGFNDPNGITIRGVKKIVLHQNYTVNNDGGPVNDIALVILKNPLTYSKGVQPINLPSPCLDRDRDGLSDPPSPWLNPWEAMISRWGVAPPGYFSSLVNPRPAIPPWVLVPQRTGEWEIHPYWSQRLATISGWGVTSENASSSSPKLLYARTAILPRRRCLETYPGLPTTQICAFRSGKAVCFGDSGGALAISIYNPYTGQPQKTVEGIVSYGLDCGIHPQAFTRVCSYVQWIHDNWNCAF